MIPMRDGVKLHTVILVPKRAHGAPILLHPYALQRRRAYDPLAELRLGPILEGYDNANEVIVGRLHPGRYRTCVASTAPRATTS